MSADVPGLLDKAHRTLSAAERDLAAGDAENAVSRAYYAAFHAASAALASEQVTARTHAGVHDLFYRNFIETGRLPRALIRTLRRAYSLRERSDYSLQAMTDISEVRTLVDEVQTFIDLIEQHTSP
ncbi:MAG TPA: HEPN domain-containing protein [Rhodothermales bacterium]|nr:HEPN domain-containing protein [Rhodothermales bacterium]